MSSPRFFAFQREQPRHACCSRRMFRERLTMPQVFVISEPRDQPEGTPATYYVLELLNGARLDRNNYKTQVDAVIAAKAAGHDPLVAKMRNPDKRKREHWWLVDNPIEVSRVPKF